jgi:hypothetical protein
MKGILPPWHEGLQPQSPDIPLLPFPSSFIPAGWLREIAVMDGYVARGWHIGRVWLPGSSMGVPSVKQGGHLEWCPFMQPD